MDKKRVGQIKNSLILLYIVIRPLKLSFGMPVN